MKKNGVKKNISHWSGVASDSVGFVQSCNSFSIPSCADTGRTAWTAAGRSGGAADDGGAGGIAGSAG